MELNLPKSRSNLDPRGHLPRRCLRLDGLIRLVSETQQLLIQRREG